MHPKTEENYSTELIGFEKSYTPFNEHWKRWSLRKTALMSKT
jgi:hypothetical protein